MEKKNSKRINVLFIMLQMEMGGAERLVHNLVLKLDRNVFAPSIAWFYGEGILKEFYDLDVPLYHVPKIRSLDFTTMQKMRNIIINNNIHIVNAHHFMSMAYSFYGCKIKNHCRLIYTEHSEWEIEKISWKWKRAGRYFLKNADGAVGVSSKVSRLMQNRFKLPPTKTFTIQNGIDLKAFSSKGDNEITLKKELGFSDDTKIVGIVANFKKIKNHVFLLKAFKELTNTYKNVKLLLIGQGFEDDTENSGKEIQNFVNQNGLSKKVMFLGYRSDIPKLLGIMDVFCLTSFEEGLPISLIEAMAAGLPVVGTDVNGIRDVIVPNRNGFLVQIDDVERLKSVLNTLLHNESLRKKFGEESKLLATSAYSLKRCVNEYQNLFLSVLNTHTTLWRHE